MSGQAFIVCVDDEQAVLNQLSAQLTRRFGASHVVECAESAEEALGLIDEIFAGGDEVQMVICDQVMPGMKGDRLLELVNRTRPEVMKVLLTGQAGLASAVYAINQASLHRYVEKPWEPEDLNLAVQNLLAEYRLRKELAVQHARLERRSRDLHALHEVGLRLAAAASTGDVLSLAAQAARTIAGQGWAACVAQVGRGSAHWAGATEALSPEARRALAAHLARADAESKPAAQPALPPDVLAWPFAHAGKRLGFLLLGERPDPPPDVRDLLSILANLCAARLDNLRLLEERQDSERLSALGRTISGIVHDFRNPMTAIKGYSSMLEQLDLPPERWREYAQLISDETDRMGSMIDEILEFTRGEKGSFQLVPTSLKELAERLARVLQRELAARHTTLEINLGYEGPVLADADRLKRALLNIASNALEAMGENGTLTLSTRLRDGRVEISLADTGPGIPDELQPRIFEPFFTHGKPRGVGLGMSIVRKIVEEHGGEVQLESRPGQGARFTVRLPLGSDASGAEDAGPSRGDERGGP